MKPVVQNSPLAEPGEEHGLLAIFFDCGDTIVDEGTEIKDERQATLRAELIPGAAEAVVRLHEAGYRLGLVADGPMATFQNVLGAYGLLSRFSVQAISEVVGVEKPHPAMFETALDALGIQPEEYGRVVMIGNNLERDIAGANALGMISVWLSWSSRRSKVPQNDLEVPDYEITLPEHFPALIHQIEETRPWEQSK
jgi:HAD superfamily hydrolase (TIGR01549 family)